MIFLKNGIFRNSVRTIFPLTRDILRGRGSGAGEFAKLAIPVLNQIVRPFSVHHRLLAGAFKDPARCREFRIELAALQPTLRGYIRALADMAQVEDLTTLEEIGV